MRLERLFPIVALASALAASGAAHAERATELFAPTQLSVARDLLDHARAAANVHDYAQAGAYAKEAQVDARLAWGMTDAAPLRAEAAEISSQATALAADATNDPGPGNVSRGSAPPRARRSASVRNRSITGL